MAKWGEGDPRWIVEERADATNVNNWHWTEKNATAWSKDKLKALLEGMTVKNDKYECTIKELTSIDGEASANNRKAKLIFFYEWVIKGEWTGQEIDSDTSYKGSFEIPNLSEENDADEVDVTFTVKSESNDTAYKVKEFMRKAGQDSVREQLAKYITDLKQEYSKGLILPTKDAQNNAKSKSNGTVNQAKKEINKTVNLSKSDDVGVKIKCKNLSDKQEFKCRASELYRAFTEKQMVAAYSGGDSMVEPEKGGRFCLFNGNITGEFTELKPFEKLCMRWRFKTWPEEHYSEVTLNLCERDDCTSLSLSQLSVPEADFDRTKEGWKKYYWDGIKYRLGFGAQLF